MMGDHLLLLLLLRLLLLFFGGKAQLPGTLGFTDDSASDNRAIEMHTHRPRLKCQRIRLARNPGLVFFFMAD